jgi:hypothetical protein
MSDDYEWARYKQSGVCIREVFALEWCVYYRDVCISEVSVLVRCLY